MKRLLSAMFFIGLLLQPNMVFASSWESDILGVVDEVVDSYQSWQYSTAYIRPECSALYDVATMLKEFGGFTNYFGTRDVSEQDALNFCYRTMGFNSQWGCNNIDSQACSWDKPLPNSDMWKYAAAVCYAYVRRLGYNATGLKIGLVWQNIDGIVKGSISDPRASFCANKDNLGGNTTFWSHVMKYALPGQYECSPLNAAHREVIALFLQLVVYRPDLRALLKAKDVEGLLAWGDEYLCDALLRDADEWVYSACKYNFLGRCRSGDTNPCAVYWLDFFEGLVGDIASDEAHVDVLIDGKIRYKMCNKTMEDIQTACSSSWAIVGYKNGVARCQEWWTTDLCTEKNVSCRRVFCNESDRSYGLFSCSKCPTSGLGSDVVFETSYKKFIDDCVFNGTATGLKDEAGTYSSGGRCQYEPWVY